MWRTAEQKYERVYLRDLAEPEHNPSRSCPTSALMFYKFVNVLNI